MKAVSQVTGRTGTFEFIALFVFGQLFSVEAEIVVGFLECTDFNWQESLEEGRRVRCCLSERQIAVRVYHSLV